MDELTQRFLSALGELHDKRDAGPLVDLFADDATLSKVGMPHHERGKQGARTFWQQYRDVFDSVEASFRHKVIGDGIIVLEWTSEGTLSDSTEFRYDGVSVLEARGNVIEAFRTYYDTAAFLQKKALQ